jgi:hypothetical protein
VTPLKNKKRKKKAKSSLKRADSLKYIKDGNKKLAKLNKSVTKIDYNEMSSFTE